MLHQIRIQELMTVVLVGVLGVACAPSTTIDQEWVSPTARTQPPLRRVVTVFISNDITMRHAAEDELARDLALYGMQATPGYAVLGDGPTSATDLEGLKAKLRGLGYDGVVVMRVLDREQDIEAVPATFDNYWGYWGTGYWGTGWPGYVYTETIYRLEAAAYSLRTGQLVWSATTETVDPSSSRELINETTGLVAGQLSRLVPTG